MPCDIGFRSYDRIKIPAPQPQDFKAKTEAPKVDAELLARVGEDDSEFAEWMQDLNINPLLKEALKRTLAKIDGTDSINFSVSENGYLEASAKYKNARQKKQIETVTNLVFSRFQLEVLSIVLELLDYETIVTQDGETLLVEGEKMEDGRVHKYVRVEKRSAGDPELRFEHFESPASLRKEKQKFFALAQKLGLKLAVFETRQSGQAISKEAVHQDFLRERQRQ